MTVGYVRVSTEEQNTLRQEIIMQELNVQKLFIEKISGKNTERPELNSMLDFLREGDTLIVESISRLARNTKDLLEIVEILNDKKVVFISKKESIDTTTPTGKFMLTVFGAVAELERAYLLDRQKEGIAAAKKQGKHLGRPKAEYPNDFEEHYNSWKQGNVTAVRAMGLLKLRKTTFYALVKKYEAENLSQDK